MKCFSCRKFNFETKKDIFRDLNGYPICESCLEEQLCDEWDDEFVRSIIDDIKKEFNQNYAKWYQNFFETNEPCAGKNKAHANYDIYYFPKKEMTDIDGKKYCPSCIDEMYEKEKSNIEKVVNN